MDLSKRVIRGTAIPRRTADVANTITPATPASPDSPVVATINRPNTDNADALAKILGVANDVGQNIVHDVQDSHDKKDAGQAALDFAAGTQDPNKFRKSSAYYQAWQYEGAKKLAIDIGDEVSQKVSDRLNDSDHPATLADIDGIIEDTFKSHITDSSGKLLDFGTPQAKQTLANALQEVRSTIIPQAQAAIKKQTDATFLNTWANNNVHEFYRGAPVGARVEVKVDPLAPLPDAATVPTTQTYSPYYPASAKPLSPFKGFNAGDLTSGMGAPREGGSRHNGEDFAVPTGTQIVAPTQGTVIASFSNARGGNQVRVKMADGAIVGFAHLSARQVKQGDTVAAGQLLGLSGQTGHATGPHVHVTVEVNGKKVSPSHYFATASVPSGLPSGPPLVSTPDDPQLAQGTLPSDQVGTALQPFDFEGAMSRVPPGIDKGEAKKFLIQSLINEANQRGDIGLLQGLEESHRKDGTPSLSPDEVAVIQQARDQITDKVRIDAANARKQLWDKNSDQVLLAFESDKKPSIGFLRDAAHKGLIDPQFAFSMENWIVNQQQEAESRQRSEDRLAQADRDAEIDADVGSRIALRQSGDLSDASPQADLQALNSGQLGSGKKALARYRMLRAADNEGQQQNLKNPEVATYAGQLRQKFGKAPTTFLEKSLGGGNVNFYGMIAFYKSEVSRGTPPSQAYFDAIQKFAPKSQDAAQLRVQRIQELRAKRLAGQ
jgi:murein DD-endopeptidase MepM/ murein hydrolase activator NlpD